MSFARFGVLGSDVYVFQAASTHTYECCACPMFERGVTRSVNLARAVDMIRHLEEHQAAGHCVPAETFEALLEETEKPGA